MATDPTIVKIHIPRPEIQNRQPQRDAGRLMALLLAVVLGAALTAGTVAVAIGGPAGLLIAVEGGSVLIVIAATIGLICRISYGR